MAEQNFPDNTIYELDNLEVLRGMNSETVDLIATDPPFNTKRNRSGSAGFYVDNDAEDLRHRPDLTDWMNQQLSKHDSHFRTHPPVRTDEGHTAAPFLAPVYTINEKSALTHREMKDYLLQTFGLHCWGCDFAAPDDRYLQLDHIDPKADGGSNHLDNRALLCQPCNQAKSNRITISELRRRNTKEGHLTKPAGTARGQDGHPINLPTARQNCREALERLRRDQPLQVAMLM